MHPGQRPPATTGFDVSLLGFIVAAVGFYGGSLTASADATPNLVRFSEACGGTRMPAAMPQDNAVMLLSRSGGDAGSAGGPASLPSTRSGRYWYSWARRWSSLARSGPG